MTDIVKLLGDEADKLLKHECRGIPKARLHLPGADFIDRVVAQSDRKPGVLRNLAACSTTAASPAAAICRSCRWTRASSTRPAPPSRRTRISSTRRTSCRLAIEGGCNGVASTLGVLGAVRASTPTRSLHREVQPQRVPLLPQHLRPDAVRRRRAGLRDGRRGAVGATVYFGSPESRRQIWEVSQMFKRAHELGMATILWCYLRNSAFKQGETDYHVSADMSGQANHLGVTIEADIIKQKMAENNGGFNALKFSKTSSKVYSELTTDHPIDLVRYQVACCYMGRAGMINSGGESKGAGDLAQAVRTAVINKRAGGMGLISGRKAFQKPMKEGVELLNAIQDVYLSKDVTIA
jgi:class I fructose-bisphosphate aldolase